MENILNVNIPFDVSLLDKVINTAIQTRDIEEMKKAQMILLEFINRNDTYLKVPGIMEVSQSIITKIYAMDILKRKLEYGWNSIGEETKKGIKEYVNEQINKVCNEEAYGLINKMNEIIVIFIMKEWDTKWFTFSEDIIRNGFINEKKCKNSIDIFEILSEEIEKETRITGRRIDIGEHRKKIIEYLMKVSECSENNEMVEHSLKTVQEYIKMMTEEEKKEMRMMERIINIMQRRINENIEKEGNECIYNLIEGTKEGNEMIWYFMRYIRESNKINQIKERSFRIEGKINIMKEVMIITKLIKCSDIMKRRTDIEEGINYLINCMKIEDKEIYYNIIDGIEFYLRKNNETINKREEKYHLIIGKEIIKRHEEKKEAIDVIEKGMKRKRKVEDILSLINECTERIINYIFDIEPMYIEKMIDEIIQSNNSTEIKSMSYYVSQTMNKYDIEIRRIIFVKINDILMDKIDKEKNKTNRIKLFEGILEIIDGSYEVMMKSNEMLKIMIKKMEEIIISEEGEIRKKVIISLKQLHDNCGIVYYKMGIISCMNFERIEGIIKILNEEEQEEIYESLGIISKYLPIERVKEYGELVIGKIVKNIKRNIKRLMSEEVFNEKEVIESIERIKWYFKGGNTTNKEYMKENVDNLMTIYKKINQILKEKNEENISRRSFIEITRRINEILITYIKIITNQERRKFIEEYNGIIIEGYCIRNKEERDSTVIWIYYHLINELEEESKKQISVYYHYIIEKTIEIIQGDNISYPDIREALFSFIRIVIEYCSEVICASNPQDMFYLIDLINWGNQHHNRHINEESSEALNILLTKSFIMRNVNLMGIIKEKYNSIVIGLINASAECVFNKKGVIENIRRMMIIDENVCVCILKEMINKGRGCDEKIMRRIENIVWSKQNKEEFVHQWKQLLVELNCRG
ncbi:hypothetical protein ENUP19_0306G0015 [Entamoeba nuttalli]|uniref:Importin N-terminal domain-containing protein n=1 Tax=Entamoeba nuttalli TaxID=412467 RepID=A0ABQ0DVT7_9EUKA